jgi:NADPH:quinone reductase-like Zn-dependent oxidoreductase
VAYPQGIEPEPAEVPGRKLSGFNGDPDPDIFARFTRWLGSAPFTVHVARTFPLSGAADAHRALEEHYLGKLALTVSPD